MALQFSIEVDDNGTPKLRKFQGEVKKTGGISESAGKAIGMSAKAIAAAGAAATAGAVALFTYSKEIAESRDKITKMGRELGVTTEFLSSMNHVVQLGGAELVTLEKGLLRLSKTAVDADSGLSTAKRGFEDLGISVTDSSGALKTNEELLFEISDAFKDLPDGVFKAAKAQELFGKSGKDLINTLSQGSDAIKAQQKEAEELGVVFDQQAGEAAEKFNDELLRLETTAGGVFQGIAQDSLPMFTDSIEDLTDAVAIAGPALVNLFEVVTPALEYGVELLSDTALGWAQITKEVDEFVSSNEALVDNTLEAVRLGFEAMLIPIKTLMLDLKAIPDLISDIGSLFGDIISDTNAVNQAVKDTSHGLFDELETRKEITKETRKRGRLSKSLSTEEEKARKKAESDRKRARERELKEASDFYTNLTEENKKQKEEELQNEADWNQMVQELEAEITFNLMSESDKRKHIINQEFENRKQVIGETTELVKLKEQELAALQAEQDQASRDKLAGRFEEISQFASITSDTLNSLFQREQNNINNSFDERKAKTEEEFKNRLKLVEGDAAKTEEIAKQRDEKLRALDVKREKQLAASAKKTAEARKRAAQLEAVVNTAAAVTKALPNIPLAVAIGIQGAAQVSLIESQKFFKGGMTDAGQQNISVGENGREFVVSAGGTRQAGEGALEDINNGRLEDAANKLLSNSGRSSGGLTLQINGGIVDEQFMNDTLIPKLMEYERRL